MRRSPALVATLLLLLAAAVPVAAGPAPALEAGGGSGDPVARQPVSIGPDDTPAMLTLNGTTRAGFAAPEVSLSESLSLQEAAIAGRLASHTLNVRFESMPNDTAGREYLRTVTQRVTERTDELHAAERRARLAYLHGNATAATTVRRLARISVQAERLQRVTERALVYERGIPETAPLEAALKRQYTRLLPLTGPVRDRIVRAIEGDLRHAQIYLNVSRSGLVLAAVEDGRYVRTAYRLDNLNARESGRLADPRERLNALYPWAWGGENALTVALSEGVPSRLNNGIYNATVGYRHGRLVSFVDGDTGHVFREIQVKELDRTPLARAETERSSREGYTLNATPSYPGGPVRITLVGRTGSAVSGEVRIDGVLVGYTGDGAVWALSPAEPYTVTVTRDGIQITLILDPTTRG